MTDRSQSVFGAVAGVVFAGTAVALGAWAAHGLENTLAPVYEEQTREYFGRTISATEKYVGDFRTGVTYQMWHGLALLATAAWTGRGATFGRVSLVLGTAIFSGSLYILALSGVRMWGAVTPIGGLLLLIGWTAMFVAAIDHRKDRTGSQQDGGIIDTAP